MQDKVTIKEKLHQLIESIDDEKILQEFFIICSNYKNGIENYELTDEQWKELKKRETDYLSGKDKGISFEDHTIETLNKRDALFQVGKMKTYTPEELDAEMKKKHGF